MKYLNIFLVLTIMLFGVVIGFTNTQSQDIQSYINRGLRSQDQANFDSARYYYNQAFHLAYTSGDQLQQSYISKLKGTNYFYLGLYDSALFQLDKSRNLAISLKCDSIQANTNLNIGYLMLMKGNTDSAEILLNLGLKQYEAISDPAGIAKAYNLLTIMYKNTGDYENGIETAHKSTNLFEKQGQTRNYVLSLINLGNIYEKLGGYDTAYSCYRLCYDLSLEHNLQSEALSAVINMAVIDYNKGVILEKKGDAEGANKKYLHSKANFIDAIEISQRKNDKQSLALCYSNMSTLSKKFNNKDEALEYLQKALSLIKEYGNKIELIQVLRNLGALYYEMGNYQLAKAYLQEGLELAQQAELKEPIQHLSFDLSGVYENTGEYKTALKYSRLSADYSDSLFNEAKQREIEKHKTNFEILHLKDLNQIKEVDKKRISAERNTSLGIGITVVFILIGLLIFFRMRAKKNRIIAMQRIQKLEDEKKLMAARSVLVGQEKERERIARELHDGIGVLLSTASIHFSSVEDSADQQTSKMLKKANKLLREAGREVRQISHNMMPGVLSKFGLKEAIEDLFEDIIESDKIEVDLRFTCSDVRLAENMEIMFYRVIQEMLNNTLKHANATKISLFISRDEEIIYIDYTDNGVGFEEEKLPHGRSLGIAGIRSRIEYLGGKIDLKSSTGKGVQYLVSVPLSEKIG